MRKLKRKISDIRYQVSFYLSRIETVLKLCKIHEYYEQDCRCHHILSSMIFFYAKYYRWGKFYLLNTSFHDNETQILLLKKLLLLFAHKLRCFIAAPQRGFIARHIGETVGSENLIISSDFRKIETRNLNLDPCILIFPVLGTRSPPAH